MARKISRKTRSLARVSCCWVNDRVDDVVEYRVVKSWTVTRVEGQYIAGGLTSKFCNIPKKKSTTDIESNLCIPARPNPMHWVAKSSKMEGNGDNGVSKYRSMIAKISAA